jgi:exo-beta-1,3-glucanase (GH17 family)
MSAPRKNRVMDAALPPEERLLFTDLNTTALAKRPGATLTSKLHGLSFSAYLDGQGPDLKTQLSPGQIRKRLELISPYTKWIRSFSCTDGNEHVPAIAKSMGLKTMVGAWIGDDAETNARELAGLIELFSFSALDEAWKAGPEGGCGPHWGFWDTEGRPKHGWR